MMRFIAIRLLQFPLILLVIYVITFFLTWVIPGSPFERTDKKLPEEVKAALEKQFHADHWYTFLAYYPKNIITDFDFGPALGYDGWSVNDILGEAVPVSVTLGLFALTLATVGGITLGTLAAVKRNGVFDFFSLGIALIGISLPSFVIASLLLMAFSVYLKWFPIGEWGGIRPMILPGIALALAPLAYITRLTRVAMLDVLGSDFVRTARAKGLSRSIVVWRHCLKNAVLPVVSYLGPAAAATLTGSFVVEKVFNIPGLGQHFVNSVLNVDQTLILGTVMVYSAFLLAFNLLVDVSYGFLDPRIDVTGKSS